MVLIQFNEHCNTHKLIPDYQSAYMANHSCETAWAKIVNDILWAMEHQKVTSLMAIDLSAALDTVNHNILLNILKKKFSVHDTSLAWFEAYLKPRYCVVNVREAYSSKQELVCSVPQGSLDGPSLYRVYTSTMQSVVPKETDLHGFVDDHVLKNSFKASNRVSERECFIIRIFSSKCENLHGSQQAKYEWWKDGVYYVYIKEMTREVCNNWHRCEWYDFKLQPNYQAPRNMVISMYATPWSHSEKMQDYYDELTKIKFLYPLLTHESAHTLVRCLFTSHLGYCNMIFDGLPKVLLRFLQNV